MLYLKLFHGRTDPTEQMNDWGSNGPILGPYEFIHTTYASRVKMGHDADDVDELFAVEDMIYYDGVYYGDWSVFPENRLEKQDQTRRQIYDPNKARLPESQSDESSSQKQFPVKVIVYIQGGVCQEVKTNLPRDCWEYRLVDFDNDPDLPDDYIPFREVEMKPLPSLAGIFELIPAAYQVIENWETGDLAAAVRQLAEKVTRISKSAG
jgi:hypothetical protein